MARCVKVHWKGRQAVLLANGKVELIVLAGGGHFGSFRLLERNTNVNALWEAPWATYDPVPEASEDYGPPNVRRFLAGYTGHALCLDYFGDPSTEEANAGLSLHGEAAIRLWDIVNSGKSSEANLRMRVQLPFAGLTVEREIELGSGEATVYVRETVMNQNVVEHRFDWVQHVTLGEPFVKKDETTFTVSAGQGLTAASSYPESSLLANSKTFNWPDAPHADQTTSVDLRRPFSAANHGFVAGVQLDPTRSYLYLVAINWKLRMGLIYFFRRSDFPWMTIWEENNAQQSSPWGGRTRARGMEFGTAPLPRGRDEVRDGTMLGTPLQCILPARAEKESRYLFALFSIPDDMKSIERVEIATDGLKMSPKNVDRAFIVKAKNVLEFLSHGSQDTLSGAYSAKFGW